MTRSTYVLSAALAGSLGLNTILATGGISPVQAVETPRDEIVSASLSPEQLEQVQALVQAVSCPVLDARLGLSGDAACSAERDLRGLSVVLDDREPEVVARFRVLGSWVPGSPQ